MALGRCRDSHDHKYDAGRCEADERLLGHVEMAARRQRDGATRADSENADSQEEQKVKRDPDAELDHIP